jgi:rubrerythrin
MREDTYTAKEILQLAIRAKAKAVDLYLVLARNSENYHVGRLFTELAKSGQKYKMHLEKILAQLDTRQQEEAYPGERGLYLKSLADANTFNCDAAMKQALELTISEEDAIEAGINFKKDFMLFLHDLKRHADENAGETIDFIIDEEIKNLRDLFHLQDKIK